jgi:hypothetical protein
MNMEAACFCEMFTRKYNPITQNMTTTIYIFKPVKASNQLKGLKTVVP